MNKVKRMNNVMRTFIVILVALAGILIDWFIQRFGLKVPEPPAWLISWAGWIATGWVISFGPRLIDAFLRAGGGAPTTLSDSGSHTAG